MNSSVLRVVPISTSRARPPLPSTQALVARVVDSAAASACSSSSRGNASSARPMPSAKSSLVVGDLPLASTLPVSSSYATVSVYVPPVSMPMPIAISIPPRVHFYI